MAKVKIQSISASERWLTCSASLQYNQTFSENINTIKGNLMHDVASLLLKQALLKENHQNEIERLKRDDYVSKNDPKLRTKWDLTCEKTVDGYVAYVVKMYNTYKPHTIFIEEKIDLKWYGYDKYGYIDCLMISDDYTIIIDMKTGRVKVETEENKQMLMYAIGVIQQQNKNGKKFTGDYIISICQGLINNIQAYQYTLGQISKFYNAHTTVMGQIISGNLEYNPSPMACKYCDHRANCVARIKKGIV